MWSREFWFLHVTWCFIFGGIFELATGVAVIGALRRAIWITVSCALPKTFELSIGAAVIAPTVIECIQWAIRATVFCTLLSRFEITIGIVGTVQLSVCVMPTFLNYIEYSFRVADIFTLL
jgi:hypothetical protein